MNEWSIHRKRVILSIALSVLIVLIGVPVFFIFNRPPTCSDGQMNGEESGIDCGGSCKVLCRAGTLPILMKGDPRVLKIATSTFEVIAYVENPNPSAEVSRGAYTFKIYEAANPVPIKTIESSTFIPKQSRFVIFQGPFDLGSAIPVRATFEWKTETLVWVKNTNTVPEVSFKDSVFSATSSPRLITTVINPSLEKLSNIELVALIMDENSNTIGAAKTFLDSLNPGVSTPVIFTWSLPFTASTTSFILFPRVLPDKSYLQ